MKMTWNSTGVPRKQPQVSERHDLALCASGLSWISASARPITIPKKQRRHTVNNRVIPAPRTKLGENEILQGTSSTDTARPSQVEQRHTPDAGEISRSRISAL